MATGGYSALNTALHHRGTLPTVVLHTVETLHMTENTFATNPTLRIETAMLQNMEMLYTRREASRECIIRPGPLLQLTNGTPVAVALLRLRIAIVMLCIPPTRTLHCTA